MLKVSGIVNLDNEFVIEDVIEFISSKPAEEFSERIIRQMQIQQQWKIDDAMYYYEEEKQKGLLPGILTSDMYFKPKHQKFNNTIEHFIFI